MLGRGGGEGSFFSSGCLLMCLFNRLCLWSHAGAAFSAQRAEWSRGGSVETGSRKGLFLYPVIQKH